MLLIVIIAIASLMYVGAWRATSSALAQERTDIQNQIGITIQPTDPTAHPELYQTTAEFAAELHLTETPSLWTTPQDVGIAQTFAPLNMVIFQEDDLAYLETTPAVLRAVLAHELGHLVAATPLRLRVRALLGSGTAMTAVIFAGLMLTGALAVSVAEVSGPAAAILIGLTYLLAIPLFVFTMGMLPVSIAYLGGEELYCDALAARMTSPSAVKQLMALLLESQRAEWLRLPMHKRWRAAAAMYRAPFKNVFADYHPNPLVRLRLCERNATRNYSRAKIALRHHFRVWGWLVTARSVTGYSVFRRFYRNGHPPNDIRPFIQNHP